MMQLEGAMVCITCGNCKCADEFAVVGFWKGEGERPRRKVCKACTRAKQSAASFKGGRDKVKLHLNAIRHRSRQNGVPFDLDASDLVIPEECPVLGIKLKQSWGGTDSGRGEDDSPSVDRLDPHAGYIKGNVFVISQLANRIKSNASIEQLEKVLEYMRRSNL